MKFLHIFLPVLLVFLNSPHKAIAKPGESISRIIVIVNKDAITSAELEERLRLVNLSAGKPVTAPIPENLRKQVMEGMIDEHLQMQAAAAKKIPILEKDVEKALENLAKDNRMTLDAMVKMLHSNGISKKTMLTRIRAQMAWGRYIREMYAPLVHISDQEVDKVLSQTQEVRPVALPPDQMDITLCQAIYPVTSDTPEEVMVFMGPKIEETAQAKGCAAFVKAARESGAKVDVNRTVKLGQLPDTLKPLVKDVKSGTCLEPAMTSQGVVITMVCSKVMPKPPEPLVLTRDMASNAVEQEKLGRKAAQEMMKLKSVAYIEWK